VVPAQATGSPPVMVPQWRVGSCRSPDERWRTSPRKPLRMVGSRREALSRVGKEGGAIQYRNGYWNTWFAHDEAQIPRYAGWASRPDPAVPKEPRPTRCSPHPLERDHVRQPNPTAEFLDVPGHLRRCAQRRGKPLQTRRALIGRNPRLIRQGRVPNYQCVNAVILEPRPVVKDETLYWMATITNADKGVNQTVMVNETGEVTVLETYEDVAPSRARTPARP